MRHWLLPVLLALLGGCSWFDEEDGKTSLPADMARRSDGRVATAWPASLDREGRLQRITRLIPSYARDRKGWAEDLHSSLENLTVPHATQTYCAAIAIIEQESSFQADPRVPGLARIVRRELEAREQRYRIPKVVVDSALRKTSPDGRSYEERIDALKTESELNALFEDMIGELPFGRQLLGGFNPVRTGGPMQVSIEFAEAHVRERKYPHAYEGKLRNEVFTRRGGVYFGSAILLDYPAPYDRIVYRFADFNAGRYSSRNAAFQAALAAVSGERLILDGDLLRYEGGKPAGVAGEVEVAALALGERLGMSRPQIRRDLLLEKSPAFARSPLYLKVFELADNAAGKPLPRQALPQIDLKSPKITRKLTTAWFARRVEGRYRTCLRRGRRIGG